MLCRWLFSSPHTGQTAVTTPANTQLASDVPCTTGDRVPQPVGQAQHIDQTKPWSVALAQIAPILGDPNRNLGMHLEKIAAAQNQGADLIVFPELSLTGYFLRDMVPDVALTVESRELMSLVRAADPQSLVLGFVEEAPGHRYYNATLYAAGGRIVHVHRKVYLPTYGMFDEGRYFARGERIEAFDTGVLHSGRKLGRVGLLVCEDLWHLSAAAIMQAEGVDVLICVANSPARGIDGPVVGTAAVYQRMCKTFAQLLGAVVLFVNRVGFEDGLCFWGGSMAVGPHAELICQAPPLDEAMVMATIDPEQIRRERLIAPLSRDEQLLLTIEELKRIKRARYEG